MEQRAGVWRGPGAHEEGGGSSSRGAEDRCVEVKPGAREAEEGGRAGSRDPAHGAGEDSGARGDLAAAVGVAAVDLGAGWERREEKP